MSSTDHNPYGSKHCLRRYLTLQIIPQTLPKKVLGSIGNVINEPWMSNHSSHVVVRNGRLKRDVLLFGSLATHMSPEVVSDITGVNTWLVVWNMFVFPNSWDDDPNLTNIFQGGLKPPIIEQVFWFLRWFQHGGCGYFWEVFGTNEENLRRDTQMLLLLHVTSRHSAYVAGLESNPQICHNPFKACGWQWSFQAQMFQRSLKKTLSTRGSRNQTWQLEILYKRCFTFKIIYKRAKVPARHVWFTRG